MAEALYRVVAQMRLADGQVAQNVYYWNTLNALGSEEDRHAELMAQLEVMYTNLLPVQSNQNDYDSIIISNITQETPGTVYPWPSLTSGSYAGDPLPPGVALLVSATTAILKVFARKYLPGMANAFWVNMTWNNTALVAAAAFGVDWLDNFTGGTTSTSYYPVVLRSTGVIAVLFDVFVRAEAGYQRRRRFGVGV